MTFIRIQESIPIGCVLPYPMVFQAPHIGGGGRYPPSGKISRGDGYPQPWKYSSKKDPVPEITPPPPPHPTAVSTNLPSSVKDALNLKVENFAFVSCAESNRREYSIAIVNSGRYWVVPSPKELIVQVRYLYPTNFHPQTVKWV